MKWTNKGREYDEVYKKIDSAKNVYLFGAGDYGHQFYKMFSNELCIKGFIDNDDKKQGKEIVSGINCFKLEDIQLKENEIIILTMSNMARRNPLTQLISAGYIENVNFFIIEKYISIYYVYKYDKVYFSSISFLPSTVCNLKCKHCLNFNPFAKEFYKRDFETLKKDIDIFFNCVDYIMLFHVSGGEPMLYENTIKIIKYIYENYRDKIGVLRTVTNGTIVPNQEALRCLKEYNVEITVDDYRDAVPKFNDRFDQLINKLEEYHIKYHINKADSWIDLAPDRTDYSNWSDEALIKHRDSCSQSWQELRDGKLYSCNYAAYATVAGIAGEQDLEEAFDLYSFTSDKKKELVEFRLGYTSKGYTNFCRKCRGFTPQNNIEVKPAIQVGES